jgi:hypothetical protein
MKLMRIVLLTITTLQLQAQTKPDRWQHPSRTWDKHQVGSIAIGTGFTFIVGALMFAPPNRTGYSVYGTGVALTLGGLAYWIAGEERYYNGKMQTARLCRQSKRIKKMMYSE